MTARGTPIQRVDLPGEGNLATRIQPVRPPADARALFIGAYPAFEVTCRDITEPGLAVVAVTEGTGRFAGLVRLAGRPDAHAAAIVGRHDHCDLSLQGHDDLPLRQLAVLLAPVTRRADGSAALDYRLLDLRTEHGFVDERGRALRGLRSDGAAITRCAGYALFVLPVGDPAAWPDGGATAWARLPERIYQEEVTGLARGTDTRVPKLRARPTGRTHITPISGPRETSGCLVADGDRVGVIELTGPTRRAQIQIGAAALRDGVLLGRYARCDGGWDDDEFVSRVHALVIQVGDAVLVVDTASTNGVLGPDAEPAPLHPLRDATAVTLGSGTRMTWRWLS